MRFRTMIEVDAFPWRVNGDHPNDRVGEVLIDPLSAKEYNRLEGAVVRFFRRPEQEYAGAVVHDPGKCDHVYHDHGWIDSGGDGQMVCPGDWIVTEPNGSHTAVHRPEFTMFYTPVVGDDLDLDADISNLF